MPLLPLFPKLPGRSWPVKETMETSTLVKRAASGRRTAVSMFAVPVYHIELKYEGLSSSANPAFNGLGAQSQQALQALFGNMLGQFGEFRLKKSDYTGDPADSAVEGQQLGIGDGANTIFLGTRTIQTDYVATFTEPVGVIEATGLNVYLDGDLVDPADYTLVWPNAIQFDTAPDAAAIVTADYTWYFLVAFEDNELELASLAKQFWSAGSINLVTVKP